jgi:glycosyltransferase involved in cell wall biosynthesis
LRVCFIAAALPDALCGIGDYTDHLARVLPAVGVEPVVLTTRRPELRASLPYEIAAIPTGWRFADTPRLLRAIEAAKPDIVHIQFPGLGYGRGFGLTALPWALLARHPRLPVALTLHEFDRLGGLHRLRVASGAVPCRLVVTIGSGTETAARQYLGRRPWSRIERIPLAANVTPDVAAAAHPADFRRRPGELVVGYWGFLRPDKGIDCLVDAFEKVRAARSGRSARLVMAGDPGPDTAYVEEVRGLVERRGLGADTIFTGPLAAPDLSAALLGFDVCVLPFRDGLAGNRGSYAGAVAHGLPIVTTSTETTGLDAATNTWFTAPGDLFALAEAIEAQASRPRLPLSARVDAEWNAIAESHFRLYRRLLGDDR